MTSRFLTRRRFLGGSCLASAATLLGCKDGCAGGPASTDAGAAQSNKVKAGLLLTLSGPQGAIGKELEQGLMLALENAGMRAGGKSIEILRRDDKNDPAVAVDLAKQLIEQDKVDLIIGPSHSHVMLALRSIIHDTKTLLLNPNAGAALVAGALCSPYIFNTGRMNPLYAETMGRYMAKKGLKNVIVLAANFAAGLDMVQGFKATFVGEGDGKVVAELLPPLTTTDFSAYLKQVADTKADAAFAFFAGEIAVHFIKQWDQAGLKQKLPLYVTGYTVEQDVLPAQGDAAKGILSVSVYSPLLDNEANKRFAPDYRSKYGTLPSEYSVLAYDAGQLLTASLQTTGGRVDDKVALVNALMSAKIESPRGPFKFGPNHTPVQDAYLREVVELNGKLTNKVVATAWPAYYYPGEGCTLPGVKSGG